MMTKLLSNPRQVKGITLLELMISMVVGLVVIGAVSSIYLMNVSATANTINSTRLMQTMNTMMTVMMNDIRRAGYVNSAAGPADPTTNIFNATGDTALNVFDDYTSANPLPFTNTGNGGDTDGTCILFAYDMSDDGSINAALDAREVTGFRKVGDVVQMRSRKVASVGVASRTSSCNDTNNDDWTDMNNANLIKITNLTFDFGNSVCLNTREPDGVDSDGDAGTDDDDEQNCYIIAAVNPDVTVETREIKITLEGELSTDSSAKYWLEQTVRVRNDLVREIP